ncbi:MAG TPA: ABC transporter permease, partial [Thermomicrobiales bacterium]|nr:ABC transporter permease [Thermomicrobiales bacterium]
MVVENLGVLAMLVLLSAVVAAKEPSFLTVGNLINIAISASIVAVAGFGMTFAIAIGGFDLSVGSVQGLAACVTASLLAVVNMPAAVAGGLLVGLAVGIVNGLLIAKLRVPAFVATLGMLGVARGAALLYTNGQSVLIVGHDDFAALNSAKPLGLPLPLLIALATLALLALVLYRTPFGR